MKRIVDEEPIDHYKYNCCPLFLFLHHSLYMAARSSKVVAFLAKLLLQLFCLLVAFHFPARLVAPQSAPPQNHRRSSRRRQRKSPSTHIHIGLHSSHSLIRARDDAIRDTNATPSALRRSVAILPRSDRCQTTTTNETSQKVRDIPLSYVRSASSLGRNTHQVTNAPILTSHVNLSIPSAFASSARCNTVRVALVPSGALLQLYTFHGQHE